MCRTRILAIIATLMITSLGWASPASARDCSTEGTGWPTKGRAEGATFLARSTDRFRNAQGDRVFLMDVLKVYAGEVGPTVRVQVVCLPTTFPIGRTYLISSGSFRPSDGGEIHHVRYVDERSVAWRVFQDRSVRLREHRSVPPPPYLADPSFLHAAVDAVTPD
jgi:hypothetical protein